jgi:hypothetical protein
MVISVLFGKFGNWNLPLPIKKNLMQDSHCEIVIKFVDEKK